MRFGPREVWSVVAGEIVPVAIAAATSQTLAGAQALLAGASGLRWRGSLLARRRRRAGDLARWRSDEGPPECSGGQRPVPARR